MSESSVRTRTTPEWVRIVIAGAFGLFYAYAVWNALDFLIAQASGTLGLSGYGWFVLLLAVAFPIIVYAVVFAISGKRAWWQFALVLLAGLGLVAVFWLNVVAYSAVAGTALLG